MAVLLLIRRLGTRRWLAERARQHRRPASLGALITALLVVGTAARSTGGASSAWRSSGDGLDAGARHHAPLHVRQQAFDPPGDRCALGNAFEGSAVASPASFGAPDTLPSPRTSASPSDTDRTVVTALADLASLADVERAQFRRAEGELLLLGPVAEDGNGLNPADWLSAVNAVAHEDGPGVSIDPGADSRSMVVRYFGGIARSHMGATFFEADRTLKLFSTGFDNLDCQRWAARPRSVPTQLDLLGDEYGIGLAARAAEDRGWHRYWFEPSEEPLREDGLTVALPRRRLVVRDESIPPGRTSPSAQQFSGALTTHFAELAGQIPAFASLDQEAALVLLAKWIRDRRVPVDRAWVTGVAPVTETPRTTPTITVTRATVVDQTYLKYGIVGGVDFRRANRYAAASGVSAPIASALRQRPKNATAWTAQLADGRAVRAVALRVRRPMTIADPTVRWRRVTMVLPQPGLEQSAAPSWYLDRLGRIEVTNNTGATLTIRLTGSAEGTYHIPGGIKAIGVTPGSYTITAAAVCGSKTSSFTLSAGQVSREQYQCVTTPVRP